MSSNAREVLGFYGKSEQTRPSQWYVVEIPDFGGPALRPFNTFAETLSHVSSLDGQAMRVFVFYGLRALLTKSRPKALIHPNGTMFPLQHSDEEVIIDESGNMDDDPLEVVDEEEELVFEQEDEDDD